MATLFDQFNLAGVSWKGYAQDLGGAQPIGSTTFVNDSVPGRDDGPCGAPGLLDREPGHRPDLPDGHHRSPAPLGRVELHRRLRWWPAPEPRTTPVLRPVRGQALPVPLVRVADRQLQPDDRRDRAGARPSPSAAGGGTNCDANHIANLDSPTDGLVHDLQNNTVPAFSWITPDNCSDAHDTTCKGNNLSGAFGLNANGTVNLNDPIYRPRRPARLRPRGDHAEELHRWAVRLGPVPRLLRPADRGSAAYAHGLIDITFDEGEPSFTYSGNSFNNVPTTGPNGQGTRPLAPRTPAPRHPTLTRTTADTPTFGSAGTSAPGADSVYGAYGISADAAGENIGGTNVNVEPYGPNSTLATDSSGDQLYPGPGNNSFIDRPPACTQTTPTRCRPTASPTSSGAVRAPAPRPVPTPRRRGSSTSSEITDPSDHR